MKKSLICVSCPLGCPIEVEVETVRLFQSAVTPANAVTNTQEQKLQTP